MTKDADKPDAVLTGNLPDGKQILVTVWKDGTGEVTLRDRDGRWGAPIALARLEVE